MSARLVVSVHDVGPASATPTAMWLDTLDRRGLRTSLLVIPGRWRGDSLADRAPFQRLLSERRAAGDEIVQHGWRHQAGVDACGWRALAARGLARGAGEFAALSQPAALLRLRAGRTVLADAGLPTEAFTAPGWLHSPGTLRALRQLGYTHTTTHTAVVDLVGGQHLRGFVFSHRPGGTGERAAAHLLRVGVRAAARAGGLVRIALHPDDLSRPGLRGATLAAIDEALDLGAAPTTYGELLANAVVS
jgi:predicted deacetylase